MAETLGSLCDKLIIIKLKEFHTEEDLQNYSSLLTQEKQIIEEIDEFLIKVISGEVRFDRLTFPSNKVYKACDDFVIDIQGNIGKIFSELAYINCCIWHEQERIYEFDKVPIERKDSVVKNIAELNLKRNNCIDQIDSKFKNLIKKLYTKPTK